MPVQTAEITRNDLATVGSRFSATKAENEFIMFLISDGIGIKDGFVMVST